MKIQKLGVVELNKQIFKHRMLGKDPRFSSKQDQLGFEMPISKMKKMDKVKLVLDLAQKHQQHAVETVSA